MKLVSTTALSKSTGFSAKKLFNHFSEQGLIEKIDDSWALTSAGKNIGGVYKESKQFGKYIAWPEDLELTLATDTACGNNDKFVTASSIGKSFELSAIKINFILSELGWVQKEIKGWRLTEQGKKQGGLQVEDHRSGVPYARWPEAIVDSTSLIDTIHELKGIESTNQTAPTGSTEEIGFREKFEAKHRATDGHMVRSKAEMLIDNWLYMAEIVHAYERKLPIEEAVYSDFYIPTGKVYIEYWGYENEPKYLARKKKKLELYEKYGFNLIELKDEDVKNLDDILPRLLLKYGVQAY